MEKTIILNIDHDILINYADGEYSFPATCELYSLTSRTVRLEDWTEVCFPDAKITLNESFLNSITDSVRLNEIKLNALGLSKILEKTLALLPMYKNGSVSRYTDSLYGFKYDRFHVTDLLSLNTYTNSTNDGRSSVFVFDIKSHAYEILRYLMRKYISTEEFDSAFDFILQRDFPNFSIEYSRKYISKSWVDSNDILQPYSFEDIFEQSEILGDALYDFCSDYADFTRFWETSLSDIRMSLMEQNIVSRFDLTVLSVLNVAVKYLTDVMFESFKQNGQLKCVCISDGHMVGIRREVPIDEDILDETHVPSFQIGSWNMNDTLIIKPVQAFNRIYVENGVTKNTTLTDALILADVW